MGSERDAITSHGVIVVNCIDSVSVEFIRASVCIIHDEKEK